MRATPNRSVCKFVMPAPVEYQNARVVRRTSEKLGIAEVEYLVDKTVSREALPQLLAELELEQLVRNDVPKATARPESDSRHTPKKRVNFSRRT